MYEILIERRAERDLKFLPKDLFGQINAKVLLLKQNPRPHGVHKIKGAKKDWRIRVRNYRIIYEINDEEHRVRIWRVKHRGEAYRKL
ncbi:MAG: type II toxin-antitoxin system RelE/ParE family toxin [Candidatus Omnitrophica bacterium]|nr:type II toxin-antitoxin system RelE/ParE family toxin [Candidatus Omnitrophota bacterium]